LWVFACAFMGCVFATPLVPALAAWAGAIDRPDQFRRIHTGAIPRMGGLGVAVGLATSAVPLALGHYLSEWVGGPAWWQTPGTTGLAGLLIRAVGVIDDTLGMGPRLKLLGQAAAVLVLFQGQIQIRTIALLGHELALSAPRTIHLLGIPWTVDLPSLAVTLL